MLLSDAVKRRRTALQHLEEKHLIISVVYRGFRRKLIGLIGLLKKESGSKRKLSEVVFPKFWPLDAGILKF